MDDTDDQNKQQLSKEQIDLITEPTVVQGWHAVSETTLNMIFGADNQVISPPDITNTKNFEPLAIIGQVKIDGQKCRKYLGKFKELVNANFLSDDLKSKLINNPDFQRVSDEEVSPYRKVKVKL